MHIVGASAAIWIITILLAFSVNPIMDWFKGGPKENQNPAASSTSRGGTKSVSSLPETSPPRSGKGMSVTEKITHNVQEKGTSSWWPRERTRSQKAGDSHV